MTPSRIQFDRSSKTAEDPPGPVRILHVEDDPYDAELVERAILRAGLKAEIARVDSLPAYEKALEEGSFDLIVSDSSLPTFDGMAALQLAVARRPEKPFVLLTGTMSDDAAVEALRSGATDYVLKDRPARLVSALRRAIIEGHYRQECLRAESSLRRTEQELIQPQKMEAMGRLAGGMAHDFNNLLTVIIGQTESVLARMGNTDPMRRDLEEVRLAADRAAALTRQLLVFSRRESVEIRETDLNEVVLGIARMLKRLIGEHISLETHLEPRRPWVQVDVGQLEQSLVNLAVNARDAMLQGGIFRMETSCEDLVEDPTILRPQELKPGPYACITLTDTGCGMDSEILSHILEPFFTTKEPGRGTGLGLSMVYGFVQQSGGGMSVRSEPGKGATFKIFLPRRERVDPKPVDSVDGGPVHLNGHETVLVAEDDPMVRMVTRRFLQTVGYTVLDASDGEEAWERVTRSGTSFDLLLTDMVMPKIGGRELAKRMCQATPGVRVLFMSGYSSEQGISTTDLPKGSDYIHKPFSLSELARKVRELLDRAI